MTTMTITEALAEIKLINNKIDKKRTALAEESNIFYFEDTRQKPSIDAKQELQAIEDLEKRKESIRAAIMKANLTNSITLNDETKTIYQWLVWKEDVYGQLANIYQTEQNLMNIIKKKHDSNPTVLKKEDGTAVILKPVFTLDDKELLSKLEKLSDTYQKIDGLLSLKNATITVTFD